MNELHLKMRETEYLVVGAGAAGCAFGFLMKRAGADVLLLEMKNSRQRIKLCAGILENRAEAAFYDIFGQTVEEAGLDPIRIEAMCVWDERNELRRAMPGFGTGTDVSGEAGTLEQKCLGAALRSYLRTGGKALAKKMIMEALGVDVAGGFSFRALPRKRFDDYIRDRFLAEGGRILYHTKVLSVNDEAGLAECIDLQTKEVFTLRSRYLICADGAVSNMRRLLTGRPPRIYLALEAAVPLIRREAVGRLTKGSQGYCWYIPRGEDATVGCGYHNLGADAMETCHTRLTEFCSELGITPPPRFTGAFIPEGDDILLRIGTRTYLLGDAAGLNDAFTGGGIHYALLSARALAASLAGAGNCCESSSAPALTSSPVPVLAPSFVGPVSYEELMQPHVRYVKKSSANLKQYYAVACSVIAGLGKRRG